MKYTLKVTKTQKAGQYHYQVIDENGTVISERRSDRKYVACTANGKYYFGRLDLIGKGDHGKSVRYAQGWHWDFKRSNRMLPPDADHPVDEERLKQLTEIALVDEKITQ